MKMRYVKYYSNRIARFENSINLGRFKNQALTFFYFIFKLLLS